MEDKIAVFIICCLFVAIQARVSMVNLTQQWRSDFGWQVKCEWQLPSNDSLQSVRLSRSEQQFFIYRPERDGPDRSVLMRLPTFELQADCTESDPRGVTGHCIISLEVLQPVREDESFTCEVSGERPLFMTEAKTLLVEALVRPSKAVVTRIGEVDPNTGRVSVNCSSSGLPAPRLGWTVGDQKVLRSRLDMVFHGIPEDFSGGSWNFTSKLFDVWSSISYTPADTLAVCTPETLRGNQMFRAEAAQYNSGHDFKSVTSLYCSLLLILALFT